MSETSPWAHVVGREFPGGSYTIDPWRAWLTADAIGDDPRDPVPHPVLAWMAAVGGKGIEWDGFFEWFGATSDDGPMFGEHRTTMHRPMRTGATYAVTGSVVSVDRKVGRRAGTFDIVGYAFELHDGDDHVATCYNSIVFPRRDPDAA